MDTPPRRSRPSFAERRTAAEERRARRATVEDPGEVLAAAVRLIENRPRTVADVRRHLLDQGYGPALVDQAMDRLGDLGYLDDAAFAAAWVESRDRARPRGARALRDELRRKGVPAGDIEAALAAREARASTSDEATGQQPATGERAATDASDEAAAARLLARRGAALAREADPRRRRQRAYALLARNGFDPSVAAAAVNAWLAVAMGGAGEPDADGDEGVGSP